MHILRNYDNVYKLFNIYYVLIMSKKHFFIAISPLLLTGCITSSPYDKNAYGTIVKVVKVKDNRSLAGKVFGGGDSTRYYVADRKGRELSRSLIMNDSINDPYFQVGECVTLWKAKNNIYYPRLGKATAQCTVPAVENQLPFDVANQPQVRSYNNIIESWYDSTVDQLVASWGNPAKVVRNNNGDMTLQYRNYQVNVINVMQGNQKIGEQRNEYYCYTDIFIRKGVVDGYSWRGNNC